MAGQISKNIEKVSQVDVVLCPPSVFVYPLAEHLKNKPNNLHLGTQNIMYEAEGAYTGEISAIMVKGICRYCIVGHSERRRIFKETDELVLKKVAFALVSGLKPIVCVGEMERFHIEDHFDSEVKRMKTEGGVIFQIEKIISGISKSELENLVFAYEPVWAIGTDNAATGAYAAAICYIIKNYLKEKLPEDVAQKIKILYGGSVTGENTEEFMRQPSIDGLLVGGASINFSEFVKICKITSEVKSGRAV